MTYNKFNPTQTDTVATWLLRLLWPYLWGPLALAFGIASRTGWGILAGVYVLIVWLYLRSFPLRSRRYDKQRYRGNSTDLKWLRRALRKAPEFFETAGLSIANPRNPDGPRITPKIVSHGPCPSGCRMVIEIIRGVQHGGDFVDRLRNLESAFERKLIVELSDYDPCRVILTWRFSEPLSQTRRPDDSPFGW